MKMKMKIKMGKKWNELCYNLKQKKTTFFNTVLIAFSLGKTKKLNDQMKAVEKIFKSRPIPLF